MTDNCLSRKTVLYVEDDKDTVELFSQMLSKHVKHIDIAYNGKEGLEKYKQLDPDIVITDIEMPIMSGLTLLSEIKKIDSKQIVVIISAFEDEAHGAKQANAVIIKPIKRKEVLEALERLC